MIALFSATGNSRLVAEALSPRLGNEKIIPILTLDQSMIEGQNRIVWVFPVHAWGVPGIVEEVINRLRFDADTEQYLVVTCGDDIGRTDRIWRRIIAARGGRTAGAFSVQMPNTYVLLPGMDTDSDNVAANKLIDAVPRIEFIAKAIRHHAKITDITPGAIAGFKSSVIRPFFRRFLMSPEPFHFDKDRCRGCGGCAKACPLGNITMDAGNRPEWGERCATCLACYHVCRSHAVEYGSRTRRKGQYQAPDSLPLKS